MQLPAAFRSLSRLSSALSAKASSLCSFLLNLFLSRLAWRYSDSAFRLQKLLPLLSASREGLFFSASYVRSRGLPEMLPHSLASDVLYISFLLTLILKILIQYSVFKVQIFSGFPTRGLKWTLPPE